MGTKTFFRRKTQETGRKARKSLNLSHFLPVPVALIWILKKSAGFVGTRPISTLSRLKLSPEMQK